MKTLDNTTKEIYSFFEWQYENDIQFHLKNETSLLDFATASNNNKEYITCISGDIKEDLDKYIKDNKIFINLIKKNKDKLIAIIEKENLNKKYYFLYDNLMKTLELYETNTNFDDDDEFIKYKSLPNLIYSIKSLILDIDKTSSANTVKKIIPILNENKKNIEINDDIINSFSEENDYDIISSKLIASQNILNKLQNKKNVFMSYMNKKSTDKKYIDTLNELKNKIEQEKIIYNQLLIEYDEILTKIK